MLINADYQLSSGVSQAINRINTPSTANFAIGTGIRDDKDKDKDS